MEIGAEVNIRFRIPQVGAEITRAEHRLPLSHWIQMNLNFGSKSSKVAESQ